ncbi:M20 family metallopeptidase [Aminipila sp.]|uniref:M20 family metallopeptidase n=1 Tax=Aminipila sp. TaxID=2060095 RepID=UPI0028A0C0E8|nr:M20/M25/M40 family metallo-hydrolase [Aminipila sp.]
MYEIVKEEVVMLLKELVGIKSPYFQEDSIMDFTKNWFEQNGMNAKMHSSHENKITDFKGKNIIVELNGSDEGPVICLNGHLDSVQLCSGWKKDPSGEIIEDRLYGLGALDMKSGCAATMIALKAFSKNHAQFKGKIISSYVSVEEGPYGMGTNALIEEGYLEGVDFSIITEPSAGFTGKPFPDLCLGARGGYGLEVEFFGASAHAATPEKGVNAAGDAARFICQLDNLHFKEDPNLGKGTACVVAVESDGGACSVPDYARVKLFWHIVVGEDEKTIESQIQEAIKKANIKGSYKINFRDAPSEASKGFQPFTVSKDEKYTKIFMNAIEDVCGKPPSLSYFQSIGDFNYLGSRLGAPALIFGAAGENFHGKDEYVLIDSVVKTAQVVYSFLEKVLT